jgi:CHAD domain-containing protein
LTPTSPLPCPLPTGEGEKTLKSLSPWIVAKEEPIAKLNCHDAAGQAIQVVLGARMEKMCALRDHALNWDDPEGVHDMRVASRRLRSALSDFKPYLRKGSMPLTRLKAIAKSLGAVRDEDVALAALEALGSKADEEVAKGIEAIVEEHRRRRVQARSVLAYTIRSPTIAEFRDDFQTRLGTATNIPDSAREEVANQVLTFSQVGTRIIGARLQQLSEAGGYVYRPLQTKRLHRLRILAKRLRYAVELFAPCWGDEFEKSAAEIARFQTSLGELHDCDIWIANLGARLKKESGAGLDPWQNNEAAVWLLRHFAGERTKHYCRALARWHKWETEGFLDRLKAMLDADFTSKAELPELPQEPEEHPEEPPVKLNVTEV